jgi:uncharacterized membrane protein
MIELETAVRIERPLGEVFSYVSDVANLPRWNSAVQSARSTSGGTGAGSTFSMRRTLPEGGVENDLEVVEHEPSRAFAIRTTSGPTPFVYRLRFSRQDGRRSSRSGPRSGSAASRTCSGRLPGARSGRGWTTTSRR